jgi:sugar fermentation stimulation protein A
VQRSDCSAVAVASDIDPGYAAAFAEARAKGVAVLCIDCDISPQEITLGRTILLH